MSDLGKQYKGQKHYPVTTVEAEAERRQEQAPFDKPDAVTIEVWFAHRKHRDLVKQAMMRAYTKIKTATLSDWDTIFANF